jgi:hypothetical protein
MGSAPSIGAATDARPGSVNLAATPLARLDDEESAATSEKGDKGEDGDHEQHRMDDHTAGDRDDEKHNTKNEQHKVALPGERALEP